MHEVSLVESLLDQLDALRGGTAGHPPPTAVCLVRVRIGADSGVEPTLFRTAYEACRGARGYTAATLELDFEPECWVCPVCDSSVGAEGPLSCADCDSARVLRAGGGIFLDRVEMEVPDV
jgi:Zn finger protein HypA/HybF involved in hydrogenase expression